MRELKVTDKKKKKSDGSSNRWKLRDGSFTSSYTTYRKDKQSAPSPGEYDPKTKKKSIGAKQEKGDVERVVYQSKTPNAKGVYAKRITKVKRH